MIVENKRHGEPSHRFNFIDKNSIVKATSKVPVTSKVPGTFEVPLFFCIVCHMVSLHSRHDVNFSGDWLVSPGEGTGGICLLLPGSGS